MEQNPAVFLQTEAHPAEDVRRLFTHIFGEREGVFSATGLKVSAKSTPNMSVDISPGACMVAGTEYAWQGHYFCESRGTVNLTVDPADTQLRFDLVVARVHDSAYSGTQSKWSLEVVKGTAASNPSIPSTPDSSLVLAVLVIAPSAPSVTANNVRDTRLFPYTYGASSVGGYQLLHAGGQQNYIICTRNTRPVGVPEGTKIYETDTNLEFFWTGSKWYLTTPYMVDTRPFESTVTTSASTVWQMLLDLRNDWQAPCKGILMTDVSGYAGSTSVNHWTKIGIAKNGTSIPVTSAISRGRPETAGLFMPVSCGLGQTVADAGYSMGSAVMLNSQYSNYSTKVSLRVNNVFWPEHLYEKL